MSKVVCPECGAEVACSKCGAELIVAAPEAKPRRRWGRLVLLALAVALALACAGVCWGGRL